MHEPAFSGILNLGLGDRDMEKRSDTYYLSNTPAAMAKRIGKKYVQV
jgi:hypothetical protein